MNMPKISVVMPVYNTANYLNEAIDSILNQTFTDFEFIIVDDCSTDGSLEIIKSYTDERIILIENEVNKGYIFGLNHALALAKGNYIARMDSDDVSVKTRLNEQFNFLEKNLKVGIVGSFVSIINETVNDFKDIWSYPISDEEIRLHLIANSPFAHPSVMLRRHLLSNHNLKYSKDFYPCEDYFLWHEILKCSEGYNIPEVLLRYRRHQNQTTVTSIGKLEKSQKSIQKLVIYDYFHFLASESELAIHNDLFSLNIKTRQRISAINNWYLKLLKYLSNSKSQNKSIGAEFLTRKFIGCLALTEKPNFKLFKYIFNINVIPFGFNKSILKTIIKITLSPLNVKR